MSELKDVVSGTVQGVLDSEVVTSSLESPLKRFGQVLDAGMLVIFEKLLKTGIAKQHELDKFKEEIQSNTSIIPENDIIEPKLSIVGPIIEASRFYIEEDELRSMFAKLLSSSINYSKNSAIHPSFVEIIKQLTPFDAKVLKTLHANSDWPVVNLDSRYSDGRGSEFYKHVFPFNELDFHTVASYSASIENLIRLSLIEIDYSKHLVDDSVYDRIRNHRFYGSAESMFKLNQTHPFFAEKELVLKKGIWSFTYFGKNFIDCCF